MKKAINAGDVPYCLESDCNGAIKPDVVFFGQSLPKEFDEKEKTVIPEADLMLVMGTSLKVAPCSTLPRSVKAGIPRMLMNMEKAGDMGNRDEDICILSSCDDAVREFADALGWRDELETIWKDAVEAKENDQNQDEGFQDGPSLDECIAKMAALMDERLGISKGHKNMLESHLSDKFAKMMGNRG